MKHKVYIMDDIYKETVKRFPWVKPHKFNSILYGGWRQQCVRNRIHSGEFFTIAKKRGWLRQRDADSFRKYIGLL